MKTVDHIGTVISVRFYIRINEVEDVKNLFDYLLEVKVKDI